jgi:hypothetical protein
MAPFEIKEVQLVRSVLGPEGATHTPIQSYPLVTAPTTKPKAPAPETAEPAPDDATETDEAMETPE